MPALPFTRLGLGNTVLVDQVNGLDATGKRGRFDLRFKTIQAAINAAVDGDLVKVGPGTYNELVVCKDGVSVKGADRRRSVISRASAVTETAITMAERMVLTDFDLQLQPTLGTTTGIKFPAGTSNATSAIFRVNVNNLFLSGNVVGCEVAATGSVGTGRGTAKLCNLLGSGTGQGLLISGVGGSSNFNECVFDHGTATGVRVDTGTVTFQSCRVGGVTGLSIAAAPAAAVVDVGTTVTAYSVNATGSLTRDATGFPRFRSTTTDPTAADDLTVGYSPGSTWVNTTSSTVWTCLSAAVGAAVWGVGSAPTASVGQIATGTNSQSTTSTAYVLISGMTITPVAGTYLIVFSGTGRTDTAGRPGFYSIHVAGASHVGTERQCPDTSAMTFAMATIGTVNGAQAIEGRFHRDTGAPGPSAFCTDRLLSIARIG